MKVSGYIFIGLALVSTFNLYLLSKPDWQVIFTQPLYSCGQLAALIGTTLLCFSFFLSSRLFWIEKIFGGLDKVYRSHHIISGIAFILLLNHPLLLAGSRLPNAESALSLLLPGSNVPNNLGLVALWGFILLICLTFYIRLPYHIWKKTHELMGLPLLIGVLHMFTVKSDITRYQPLYIYMLLLTISALGAYVYKKFLYSLIGPSFRYRVSEINRIGDIIEIVLAPLSDNRIRFNPGQFVYLSMGNNFSRLSESHPFTISSSPKSPNIRLTIKIAGDDTLTMRKIRENLSALLSGPYGSFGDRYAGNSDAVMIAGGIGITPFLSMIPEVSVNPDKKVYLFHSLGNSDDNLYENEIKLIESENSNFRYIPRMSKISGRFDIDSFKEFIPDLKKPLYFLCGPPLFMNSITQMLKSAGVRPDRIITEDFTFI